MATPRQESVSQQTPPAPASPTLPLPPPRAAQIRLDEFIEVALSAALRAVEASSDPGAQASLNPQPLPPRSLRPIIIGIIIDPQVVRE